MINTNLTDGKVTDFIDEIANFIFTSKYSRFNERLGRRETWTEAVGRLETMHLKKYSFLPQEDKNKIRWAFDLVRDKRVIPSMRSLQFGGKAIEAHNARGYNCCVRHIDSLRSFAEVMYLLLCGCGVGIGLSRYFLGRLPDLVNSDDKTGTVITYVVEDDMEGWADSIEALLSCYFRNTPYTGRKIVFDYSRIRKKGTPLKTGGGKAPGYKGLKATHIKIKTLLDYVIENQYQVRLKSVNAYDILMHCADAVLSGGVRRSATSVIFDKDDEDMLNAKTFFKVSKKSHFEVDGTLKLGGTTYQLYNGKVTVNGKVHEVSLKDYEYEALKKDSTISWIHIEPQRARSNNSILLMRNEVTIEEFRKVIERTKQFGEPGFCFANHPHSLLNPCVTADTEVLTKDGYIPIGVLVGKKVEIWNGFEWSEVAPKLTAEKQELLEISFSDGRKLKCTDYHKFHIATDYLGSNIIKEAIRLEIGDKLIKHDFPVIHCGMPPERYAYDQGFYAGDGTTGYNEAWIYPPKYIVIPRLSGVIKEDNNRKLFRFNHKMLSKDFVPLDWTLAGKLEWLAGLLDSDGSELKEGGAQIVSINFSFLSDVQKLLSIMGIQSKVVHASDAGYRLLPDGQGGHCEYYCQEAKRICIGATQIQKLKELGLRCERLKFDKNPQRDASQFIKVVSIKRLDTTEDVYCFNEPKRHLAIFNGVITGQCYEVNFIPVTSDGICGVQMCNLTSQNGRLVTTKEIFRENCEASAIIGTLQAGYTHFPYLSNTAALLTREEALLGCSITGVMDNPEILLNPDNQKEMAALIVEVNISWAEKLNINPAARTTLIKPEGTSSLVLGTASGIHPHHSRRYFRRVQCNTDDHVYKLFKKANPKLCEPSVWSANKTDDVITFPIEIAKSSLVKTNLGAIEHLDKIKSTQTNWVIPGTTNSNKKPINHNVSCTVVVSNKEWEEVIDYLFKNRNYFAAVALLPASGDKDYPQAPMESIVTPEDEKHWEEITSNFKHVDYKLLNEDEDNTNLSQEGSCYGGACQIV